MSFSEVLVIIEDEIFRGSKRKYTWFFGGIFIFLCFLVMHYSTYISFLVSTSKAIPYSLVSYLVILFIGPFIIMITSFDIISSEIETGSIRYVISKVHRSSFILGKFFFLFLLFIFVSFGIALISLMYQYSIDNIFQCKNIILFWIFSSLYLGCFISIFLFISTLSVNNKISFTMSIMFLGILVYFFLQGHNNYLKYITPFFYGVENVDFIKSFSVKDGYLRICKNLFSMILYILAFLSISIIAIKRRDL